MSALFPNNNHKQRQCRWRCASCTHTHERVGKEGRQRACTHKHIHSIIYTLFPSLPPHHLSVDRGGGLRYYDNASPQQRYPGESCHLINPRSGCGGISLLQSVLCVPVGVHSVGVHSVGVHSLGVHKSVLCVPVGALFLLHSVLYMPVGGQSMSISLPVPKP